MKTAISIPDDIFQSAEQLAHRLGVSRSELYVQALKSYLQDHHEDGVTDALNTIYGDLCAQLDPSSRASKHVRCPRMTGHDPWRHLVGRAA